MNSVEALITIFYSVLDEAGRRAVLKETLIDDQPCRHQEEYYDRIREWMRRHRAAIAPLLLRYVDPPDHLVEKLAAEGDLQIPRGKKLLRFCLSPA